MSSYSGFESSSKIASLSSREKGALEHLVNGTSIRAIAAIFAVENAEAEKLVRGIMTKLSVDRIADLVRIGLEASYDRRL